MKIKLILLSLLVISIILNVVLFIRQSAEEMLNHAVVISCERVKKNNIERYKCGGQTMFGEGFEFVFNVPDFSNVPEMTTIPQYNNV